MKEGYKAFCVKILMFWYIASMFCKNNFVADLLSSSYLFEILQTSFNVKNSKNVVKSPCFEKLLRWRAPTLFQNEVKI